MRQINLPPHAPALMESMRSIGYTLESALADLLDNSVSAKSTSARIEFRVTGEPYVALLDDGHGMGEEMLQAAMRHGSRNPLEIRSGDDLGRYGLGLKTASLSQCRRMTLVSFHGGHLRAYAWDLDTIIETGAWTLLELDREEIISLPHASELLTQVSGTMVLWQRLDRLCAGESSVERAVGQKMDHARDHLAMVFHRYLGGEPGLPRIRISINSNQLQPIDPFLTNHRGTQRLDEEKFVVEGARVSVKPFILPHLSKLSKEEVEILGGSDGFRNQQGFYVYRNHRLIIWGTWFRLARKDEISKLARVRVDIPNTLDHLWTLDIKKSVAAPPEEVRTNLKRTVQRIRDHSGQTISYRGRAANAAQVTPAWLEILDRDGVRYEINRSHPAILKLVDNLSEETARIFNSALKAIEMSFPAEALYARMASELRPTFNREEVEGSLRELAITLITGLSKESSARKALLDSLHLLEPFSAHSVVAKKIAESLIENE